MPTREQLHKEVDAVPDHQLEHTHVVVEPNGAGEDSATISAERRAALAKLAGYFEQPETAPWDWDVLRNAKYDAWRV